jgi:hypothetical protein
MGRMGEVDHGLPGFRLGQQRGSVSASKAACAAASAAQGTGVGRLYLKPSRWTVA